MGESVFKNGNENNENIATDHYTPANIACINAFRRPCRRCPAQ
jgi:hypothetical protein